MKDGEITFYQQGDFIDLCKGPHIPNTHFIKAVKLINVAGAYWKGDEKNQQLTRVYGITFQKQKELNEYLIKLEEAKQRDHRKIVKNMSKVQFSWIPEGPRKIVKTHTKCSKIYHFGGPLEIANKLSSGGSELSKTVKILS